LAGAIGVGAVIETPAMGPATVGLVGVRLLLTSQAIVLARTIAALANPVIVLTFLFMS
jgi:hypothetical protein